MRKPPQPRKKNVNGYEYAVVTLTDSNGKRKDHILGRWDSPCAEKEYSRLIAEWQVQGQRLDSKASGCDVTIAELIERFWLHAEQHYRHSDGTPTDELPANLMSLRPLRHLYGHTLAREFGPLALKSVRQLMVEGYEHPDYGPQAKLARRVVNQRIGRLKRMFAWGTEEELIPPSVFHALQAVKGLQAGRSAAHETEEVRPVSETVVRDTLPHLTRQVGAMVRLQLLTGARPGEIIIMRGCDLETAGNVWFYRPGSDGGAAGRHKTAHHGHKRIISIGPRGQVIIKKFLKLEVQAFLFSPQDAIAEHRAKLRSQRKSKVQPSQTDRSKPNPERAPGLCYSVGSFGRAIAMAIKAANTAKACKQCKPLKPEERCDSCRGSAIPHWHPHQLRHTAATNLRREFGLDTARVVLGHRSPAITEIYAELYFTR